MNAREATNRALRSFLQGFVASLLTSPFTTQPNTPALGRVLQAAILAGAYGLLSFAHNLLEDNTNVPPLLKPTTPTPTNTQA